MSLLTDIGFQLHVFTWAVKHYPDDSKVNSLVREMILEFTKTLGYEQDTTRSLPDQAEALEREYRRGQKVIGELKVSFATETAEIFRENSTNI